MIQVTATKTVTRPEYRTFSQQVNVNGFDRLTPRAARAALEIAFGKADGVVWYSVFNHEAGCHEREYGYRVYGNSARKIYPEY
jgi:hypothetical protein